MTVIVYEPVAALASEITVSGVVADPVAGADNVVAIARFQLGGPDAVSANVRDEQIAASLFVSVTV